MDLNGQAYFDQADKVPEEDVERLRREMEQVGEAFKDRVQELMKENEGLLRRLADGPE